MNNNDLLTILGCGALGYGIIHLALNKPAPPTKAAPPPQPQATFAPAWARVL
jgi:hypothetical protein